LFKIKIFRCFGSKKGFETLVLRQQFFQIKTVQGQDLKKHGLNQDRS